MYKLILANFLCFFSAYSLLAMEKEEEKPLRHSSIRRADAKSQLVKKTPEQEIDDDYYEFISNISGFEHLKTDKIDYLKNPKEDIIEALNSGLKLRQGFNINHELPPGDYANPRDPAFAIRKFGKRDTQQIPNLRKFGKRDTQEIPKQGWKIHISALPHSAQKIASYVLKVIEAVDNNTYYKIISSIPAMRSMYYITGNLEGDGRETQTGKFITIYPRNKKHARALVEAINKEFLWDKMGKTLSNDDFYPLTGEARIGETDWVYIRYGNITSALDQLNAKKYIPVQNKEIIVVPPKKNKKMETKVEVDASEEASAQLTVRDVIVKDDRFHPWPDYMNYGDPSWNIALNPFPGLNMRWNNITWETRPNSWDDIKNIGYNEETLTNNDSSKKKLERRHKRLSSNQSQK